MTTDRSERTTLLGRTIRWRFADGPVAGQTFEHTFNDDGSVVWRSVDGKEPTKLHHEKFGAVAPISDDVVVVSYVSAGGYTLTVALNLAQRTMVGFGSGHDTWAQQKGTFELLPEPA
jgi:hypothetical protein